MAKSNVQKKIESYKKMSRTKIIGILVILLIAMFIYIYNATGNDTHNYSTDQNPETGYYYYHQASSGTYYYQANDLVGAQLKSQLHVIVNNGFVGINYGDVRVLLETADQTVNDPSKLWNIYDGVLVGAVWDSGVSWQREHVWPNSRLGVDDSVNNTETSIASDAHNLRAISPGVNQSRSNRFYSDGNGDATTTSDGGYYPGDDHRGDVARILFYMATMYNGLTLTNDKDLLNNEALFYTTNGTYMGELSLLLSWHREDPVSEFEIHRNNIIYATQANRNPFIDHPEYVHLIWEGYSVQALLEPTTTAFSDLWKASTLLWMNTF